MWDIEIQLGKKVKHNRPDIFTRDFIEKMSDVINKVATMKEICIKSNTVEWIDEEILEGIRTRYNFLENSKNKLQKS